MSPFRVVAKLLFEPFQDMFKLGVLDLGLVQRIQKEVRLAFLLQPTFELSLIVR